MDTVVYIHRRLSDNAVFYIGIGGKHRPHEWGRNQWWERTVTKHGYEVEVLHEGLEWAEACRLERELIAEYRAAGAPLTNLTDGGEGVKGWNKLPENAEWALNVTKAVRKENKRRATDPEWRRKMQEVYASPDWQRSMAEGNRRLAADPKWQSTMQKLYASAEWRRKNAEAAKRWSADPEWLSKNAEANRRKAADPEFRLKHAEAMKKLHADPEFQRTRQELYASPEFQQAHAEGIVNTGLPAGRWVNVRGEVTSYTGGATSIDF